MPGMVDPLYEFSTPGPFTSLRRDQALLADGLSRDPVEICAAVQRLVIQPHDTAAGIGEERAAERDIRAASELVDVLTGLDPAPLHQARPPQRRVVGTCRHFATLSCALLRHQGIPARARCGFATYFVPGKYVDHWIVEYWHQPSVRWIRVDAEVLGQLVVARPDDLAPGEFLTGGEAWTLYRKGAVDPDLFGVAGADHAWGVAEIRGNAIRDLASLCKRETLPWDEWGRMTASYRGDTGPDYDELLDRIATATAGDSLPAIHDLYESEDLPVPLDLLPPATAMTGGGEL